MPQARDVNRASALARSGNAEERDIARINRDFYDALWSSARLSRPEQFNTWPLISGLLPAAEARLEIGPGLHPRLPIAGTHFIDISAPAVAQLKARGGLAAVGEITALPFSDQEFDLVGAFDVVEHVRDDRRVLGELSRVLRNDGMLIFSVPLHASLWSDFDDWVGHVRRYEPSALAALLEEHHLVVEKSAAFGMKPSHPGLLRWGMQWLTDRHATAMRWYNGVLFPLGLLLQKRLKFADGWIETTGVDGIVLACRRRPRN
ncbi:MAG TPA: class I SAM-dependent methyltransferase [Verrucomicrobiae bacterium]|nr:class I SAM-dependent methyltransferase [Verrucomicrobiae bacterium]